jgi:hypothetical protein
MAHNVGIEVASPVEEKLGHSTSALRMRRHRERRRQGSCCVTIELSGYVIDQLIRRRRLSPDERYDRDALRRSLTKYLDYALWG